MHITPRLVYCTIVFSVLKTYRASHSGVSLGGMYNCDCERYCGSKQCAFLFFIPRQYISFSVPIHASYLESRNIRLVNSMCYTQFKCKVSEQ